MKKKKIAIFASGNGTNAAQLIKYFKNNEHIQIALIITNSSKANVISLAEENDIPFSVVNKSLLANNSYMTSLMNLYDIDFIVLAGFLLLMPPFLVKLYDYKMINIHPALLPKFGGKGMYGLQVHQAVLSAGESESGITIHYVNEMYDKGKIIFQAKCNVEKKDTAEKLAKKVQDLEHQYLPEWTEKLIMQMRYM
ncbi:MAG: phosphoribosylglycinamide formyltransferase [Saprospiraceae bacterium]|jgi:phosphoribosylglycinamide formyltransferase 1|uniref:Phosphoribosylglycinamide formyltransferase n=1 Tax=Candidatus Defluviibacterium haderslevense TaxID=2981993 RepID=A0A9D7SEJ5_9BACT|nr:phosphoribosylglycinamide formyltransferase [Candidatus Defluviibacterium haderslevense]MCC7028311.1 phosphoribosylglycinamide formyltransferase [Saprospiraceae bacterium]MBK7244565.1 phosphoribosylglycinamide formyltransferase [Candidatus Defluviibacterium haderslevense]MBK9719886.1 phosphoribosylglycinamide formyltransferase [Candidatus Defluviibacterium haderslevense]MCI1266244.1 phosphoribosylglycinamide formyltransferase [Saprospiraceae bacterium]